MTVSKGVRAFSVYCVILLTYLLECHLWSVDALLSYLTEVMSKKRYNNWQTAKQIEAAENCLKKHFFKSNKTTCIICVIPRIVAANNVFPNEM